MLFALMPLLSQYYIAWMKYFVFKIADIIFWRLKRLYHIFRNNTNGQLGTDNREDSVVPKLIGSFQQPIKMIAAGTQHSLAVTGRGKFI